MINQTAQGLASLGRNGDSMLVHMSPKEVSGLQGLAMAQGGSLTINPDTGLPEAFSLKNLFKSALPIAAGFMFPGFGTQIMGGMLGQGIAAGALTGAGISALSGEDPLMGAISGGLGGYGGAGLAGSAGQVGAIKGAETGVGAGNIAEANLANIQNISPYTPTGIAGTQTVSPALTSSAAGTAMPGSVGYDATAYLDELSGAVSPNSAAYLKSSPTSPFLSQTPGLNTSTLGIKEIPSGLGQATAGGGGYAGDVAGSLQTAGENFGTLLKNPMDVVENYGFGKSAMLAGAPILSGVEPSDIYGKPYKPKEDRYDPYATLNLNNDTGLRLIAKGGYINGYALGGAVNTNPSVGGGLSDLYNRPEGATTQTLSNDGYGIGRLNNLAGEQSRYQAQTLGYADGGNVGMNMDKLPTLNLETGQQSGGDMGGAYGGLFGAMLDSNPEFAKQLGIPENTSPQLGGLLGAMMRKNPEFAKQLGLQEGQYARGGYLNGAGDGMSDSIPATIEGKQPARLADGEFVIPADVVSHLGNGSSKAGSKRLYAMLDKVRTARTGNKKQGKEINPNKYLPA